MDVWKNQVQQDISDLKQEQGQIKNDVAALKINDKLQDSEISYLRDMLKEIRNDTQWIRRKVTGAIITAIITAVVGGLVGIVLTKLF
ncbi:hypothetical protein J14TS2_45170 [Bacillus sp. J14TS2]|uniref:hemolysin XhlA family protein n=1 Tax=Bacillus sp. J14TS2 TaxID=2807188 RepID=UPI001B293F8D|nr:hemolysin XhlA family protein [Bacillus sp. J14TS2]GIN74042.1 hypothetical protein J14TS2_45170 [Bacillus sp. J14TS2]